MRRAGARLRLHAALVVGVVLAASCGQKYYDTVIAQRVSQLKDPTTETRAHAAWSLGQLGPRAKAAVPALTEALADPEVEVRRTAAQSLEQIGEESAPASEALTKLLDDEDAEVRTAAATTLGVIGAPAAVPAVPRLIALLGDEDSDVRAHAAWALGELGPDAQDAVGPLTEAMQDKDATVRQWSAEALLRVKGMELPPGGGK